MRPFISFSLTLIMRDLLFILVFCNNEGFHQMIDGDLNVIDAIPC